MRVVVSDEEAQKLPPSPIFSSSSSSDTGRSCEVAKSRRDETIGSTIAATESSSSTIVVRLNETILIEAVPHVCLTPTPTLLSLISGLDTLIIFFVSYGSIVTRMSFKTACLSSFGRGALSRAFSLVEGDRLEFARSQVASNTLGCWRIWCKPT